MRFSKVVTIISVTVGAVLVLAVGVLVAKRARRINSDGKVNSPRKLEHTSDAPRDWSRVDIQEGVAVYLPPSVLSNRLDWEGGYTRFRSAGMEILFQYSVDVTACAVQQLHASAIKVEPISIDGKQGKLQTLEKTAFNVDDDESLAVKGFGICIPNVGDNTHQFSVVGKYKTTEDHQTLSRIIDTIKFFK